MNLNNLKIGDLIVREKGIVSTHYMVYAGIHNGQRLVAENQFGFGVRYIRFEEAVNGYKIIRTEPFGGTESQRMEVIPLINQLVGKSYDLVRFNCEHFASYVAKGIKESNQIKNAGKTLMAGGLGIALIGNKNKPTATIGILTFFIGLGLLFLQDDK